MKVLKKKRFVSFETSYGLFKIWDFYLVKQYSEKEFDSEIEANEKIKQIEKSYQSYYFERQSDFYTYL